MLSITVLVCYFAAALCLATSVYRIASNGATFRSAGLLLATLAVISHTIILWQGVAAKPSFALTIAETASLIGFGIALIAVITCLRQPRFSGASAILLAVAGLVGAATNEGARNFVATQHGWELSAHIALSVLAYASITVGVALALALTLLDQRLRKHAPLGWLSILPSVEALETGMFASLTSGFALLSLALFSGFVFVEDLRAQHISHKAILSSLAWVSLAILLIGRWRFGWRGRKALYWTLGSFVTLGFAYFGSRLVLEQVFGRHWG